MINIVNKYFTVEEPGDGYVLFAGNVNIST